MTPQDAPAMKLKAWCLFIVGDLASRVPWDSRLAARVYSKAMQYPARVGIEHNVGPFRSSPTPPAPDPEEDE